jgi:hypothetical protein
MCHYYRSYAVLPKCFDIYNIFFGLLPGTVMRLVYQTHVLSVMRVICVWEERTPVPQRMELLAW